MQKYDGSTLTLFNMHNLFVETFKTSIDEYIIYQRAEIDHLFLNTLISYSQKFHVSMTASVTCPYLNQSQPVISRTNATKN